MLSDLIVLMLMLLFSSRWDFLLRMCISSSAVISFSVTVIKCHFNIAGIFKSGVVNFMVWDSVYLPLIAFLLYLSSLLAVFS